MTPDETPASPTQAEIDAAFQQQQRERAQFSKAVQRRLLRRDLYDLHQAERNLLGHVVHAKGSK